MYKKYMYSVLLSVLVVGKVEANGGWHTLPVINELVGVVEPVESLKNYGAYLDYVICVNPVKTFITLAIGVMVYKAIYESIKKNEVKVIVEAHHHKSPRDIYPIDEMSKYDFDLE